MPNEYIHPSYHTQEDVLLRHDLIGTPDRRNQQHPHRHPASLVPVPLHRDSQEELLATEQQSAILSLNVSTNTVHHPLQNYVPHKDDLLLHSNNNNNGHGNRTTGHMFANMTQNMTQSTNNNTSGTHIGCNHAPPPSDPSQFHHTNQHYISPPLASSTTDQHGSQTMMHTNAPHETRLHGTTPSFHVPCHNSCTETTAAVAVAVVAAVTDTRKRAHTSMLNHATMENPPGQDGNKDDGSHHKDGKVIKARKAFSLKEKLAYVMAFKRDCQKCNNGSMKQTAGEEDKEGDYEVLVAEDGTQCGYQQRQMRKQQSQYTTIDVSKTKKLKAWLKDKNQKEGTNIAYATMYKWVKKYGKMDEERGSDVGHSSVGHLKKLRTRPHQELETILVEYLRVRNETLRKRGLPLSSVAFIKDRANMFYRDMYGNGDDDGGIKGFKCSSGENSLVLFLITMCLLVLINLYYFLSNETP